MVEKWDASSTDRGTCPGCGGDYQLTKKGLVRRHVGLDRMDCPGSGQRPEEG